jgi:hypothetical protein
LQGEQYHLEQVIIDKELMTNLSPELLNEYHLVEQYVRENYKDTFEKIESELREKWFKVWEEQGFDTSTIQLSVTPQIRVVVLDKPESDTA